MRDGGASTAGGGKSVALFGTDGARGQAPRELTPTLALAVGAAAVAELSGAPRVLVGRDTRVSGPMLEAAVVAGITAAGGRAALLGVVPTPAVAALVPLLGADAGLVISASHNPPEYNGLKLLDSQGRKWTSAREAAVAERVAGSEVPWAAWNQVGGVESCADRVGEYRDRLVAAFAGRVGHPHVVVDLGFGAALTTVPAVLEALGLVVTVLNGAADGTRINQGVGATHPEVVAQAVRELGADIGFSFDGDADRVMACDADGHVINGDGIIYLLARGLKDTGGLPGGEVVGTVMANLGLERALGAAGIHLHRTPVGDRWVAQAMAERAAPLGGEQSGHVILSQWAVTGDGLLTALAVLAEMHRVGGPASALVAAMPHYPQRLENVRLPAIGFAWEHLAGVDAAFSACTAALGGDGRLLVRASGTEPLLRIMIEGRDAAVVEEWADRLTAVVREALASGPARSNSEPQAPEPR